MYTDRTIGIPVALYSNLKYMDIGCPYMCLRYEYGMRVL